MQILILVVLFMLTAACQLSGEQQQALGEYFRSELEAGRITPDQYQALFAAITAGDWAHFRDMAISIGLGIAGSLAGVQLWRGGVNSRKGHAPAA